MTMISRSAQPRGKDMKKSWNLGFFSRPFLVMDGPDRGKIAKVYRPIGDKALCDRVARNHDVFVRKLKSAGIRVPATEIRINSSAGRHSILVLQSAFREEELVRAMMLRSSKEACLKILKSLLEDTLRFLSWRRKSGETIGFHPTLRNYAIRQWKLWYFDTFPPMWGWDQQGLNRIIIRFAPFGIFRFLYFFSKKWVDRVSNEYFRPELMITGLVGSSCRLRPDLAADILAVSRKLLGLQLKDAELKRKVMIILSRPPRLPGIWVFLRGLVGKEGKPNV